MDIFRQDVTEENLSFGSHKRRARDGIWVEGYGPIILPIFHPMPYLFRCFISAPPREDRFIIIVVRATEFSNRSHEESSDGFCVLRRCAADENGFRTESPIHYGSRSSFRTRRSTPNIKRNNPNQITAEIIPTTYRALCSRKSIRIKVLRPAYHGYEGC